MLSLNHVDLNRNQLIGMHPSYTFLFRIPNVRQLHLNFCSIPQIEIPAGSCRQLELLSLTDNLITEIPDSISHAINLHTLLIDNEPRIDDEIRNNLHHISPLIIQCNLKHLNLIGNPELFTSEDENTPDYFQTICQNTTLKSLMLDDCNIMEIPDCIENLQALENLSLTLNILTDINTKIGRLSQLQVLLLSSNLLEYVPEELTLLQNLKVLELSNNNLFDVFGDKTHIFPHLIQLTMHQNNLPSIPGWISQCSNLKILDASYNLIETVPDLCALQSLTSLDLSDNRLGDFQLRLPRSITRIILSNNQLTQFPAYLRRLTLLQELNVSSNAIANIDHWIEDLSQLKVLNLSGNPITFLTDYIQSLSKLEEFNVSYTRITHVPEWIINMTSIIVLDLSDTLIRDLPLGISNMTNLEVLKINDTMITELEPFIGTMPNLTELYIGNTGIQIIPQMILNNINIQIIT